MSACVLWPNSDSKNHRNRFSVTFILPQIVLVDYFYSYMLLWSKRNMLLLHNISKLQITLFFHQKWLLLVALPDFWDATSSATEYNKVCPTFNMNPNCIINLSRGRVVGVYYRWRFPSCGIAIVPLSCDHVDSLKSTLGVSLRRLSTVSHVAQSFTVETSQ